MAAVFVASVVHHNASTPRLLGALGPDPSCGRSEEAHQMFAKLNGRYLVLAQSRRGPYWYWRLIGDDEQ